MNIAKLERTRLLEILRGSGLQDDMIEMLSPAEAIEKALEWEGIVGYADLITDIVDDARSAGVDEDSVEHKYMLTMVLTASRKDIINSLRLLTEDYDEDRETFEDRERFEDLISRNVDTDELVNQLMGYSCDFSGFDANWSNKIKITRVE